MKNKLFVFGDSMSTNFTTTNEVSFEESWPYLLSKKLNLDLINHAIIGASNGEILNRFFEKAKEITKDDVVVIQIGFYERLHDIFKNTTVTIGYDPDIRYTKNELDYFKSKIIDLDEYITFDLIKFAFIFKYCEMLKCKFIVWKIDKEVPEDLKRAYAHFYGHLKLDFEKNLVKFNNTFSCMDGFIDPNPMYWCNDGDKHFNKLAHSDFFQYLYSYIQLKKYEI